MEYQTCLLYTSRGGTYTELLNSDAVEFGGSGVHNEPVKAQKGQMHGFDQFISIKVPPMSTVILSTPAKRAPRGTAKKAAPEKAATAKSAAKKKTAVKTTKKNGKQAK